MRNTRLAAVSYLLDNRRHTIEKNLTRACAYIAEAKQNGADIVCLPESVMTINTSQQDACVGEKFPGPWTEIFSGAARMHGINVIAPYYVTEKKKTYNQATVFDRKGTIAGMYRKIQPHALELKRGVTPGDAFPVITLDIGRIAVMICFDIYFPEIARIYAMKGAEILFWPTMTVGPTQEGLTAQLISRAIDNSLHVVESNYAQAPPYAPHAGRWRPGNARIVDFNGAVRAQTGHRAGLAIADIDLSEQRRTSQVVLRREPDHTREDIEAIARMELYAKEYSSLSKK
jgi:predicted amidohydrolase